MKLISFVLLLILFQSCSSKSSIKIATSANMLEVMQEIVVEFNKKNNFKIEIVSGPSGVLTSQIDLGAPFDVFVSANIKYPNYLANKLKVTEKPKIYAFGHLVLVSKAIQPSINDLTLEKIKTIGVPNPKTAPYGLYCIEALKNYQIYEKVKNKLIFGESVGQTNSFIYSGAVDVGITAKSSVMGVKKVRFNWVSVDSSMYSLIPQSAILLDDKNVGAKLFYDFLFTEKVKTILVKYGFGIP